jgi:tRNA(Ile)-lysidine synthase
MLLRACYNRPVKNVRASYLSDPLIAALIAGQEEHRLLPPGADQPLPLVVGVSGGADSVCLLHALRLLADAWRLQLHVAHVDHGLRPQAAADHAFVAELAANAGLPFHTVELDPVQLRASPNGLEAAARTARYAFLAQVARSLGSTPVVAVAHHAGDQAETLLLHLAGGSGLRGLGGLRPRAVVPVADGGPPVRLVRPLLGVDREEILAFLARYNLTFVEDETNTDLHFARNYVRHTVLPVLARLNPQIGAALARSAELLAAEAERATAADAAAMAAVLLEPPTDQRVVLDLEAWQGLSLAAQRGVLRLALAHFCADGRELGFEHINAILHSTAGARGSGPHPLPGGFAWTVIGATASAGAKLCLHRSAATPLAPSHPFLDAEWRRAHTCCPLPIPGQITVGAWRLTAARLAPEDLPDGWPQHPAPWRMYADAAALGEPVLAAPGAGQRIAPFGMGGAHRLVTDVLADHKIPASMRGGWPLLLDRRAGRVLWVCGLRLRKHCASPPRPRQSSAVHGSGLKPVWKGPQTRHECQRQAAHALGHLQGL